MTTTNKPELKSVAIPVRIIPKAREKYQNTTLTTIDAIRNGLFDHYQTNAYRQEDDDQCDIERSLDVGRDI